MKKRFWIVPFLLMTAALVSAQDMPPLPALPDQGNPNSAPASNPVPSALPPLPDQSAPAAPPAPSGNTASAALPPLPDQNATPAPAGNTAPPLPGDKGQPAGGMPPLPGDQTQPAAGTTTPPSPANPPSAGDQTQPAAPEAAAPATEAATPAEENPKPKKAKAIPSWKVSKYRPNAIFDGWVRPKGGNESSRLAWTSQEVLNTFLFKGYKNLPEEGVYDGEGKKQWRRFTFQAPKSKQTFHVYVKGEGRKVWLRVRPGEPALPAAYTLAQVKKMRQTDLAALHLLQKKFKGRLRPGRVIVSWEPTDYQRAAGETDE